MIIFSQSEQCKNLRENGFEKWPNFRDLMILAKELKFKEEYKPSDIETWLVDFCAEKSPNFSREICKNLVEKCINKLKTTENYTELPEKIAFFKEECEEIAKIQDAKQQKLIFILCCLSKLKKSDGIYLNSSNSMKLSDVFELSNVKIAQKNQEVMFHELKEKGLLTVDLRPLLKIHPTCLKMDGEIQIEFEPNAEMLKNLFTFNGCPTFVCERCGKVSPKVSNRCKYCAECAAHIRKEKLTQQQRERRARIRAIC